MNKGYQPGDLVGVNQFKLLKREPNRIGIFECQERFCIGFQECTKRNFKGYISDVSRGKHKTCGKFQSSAKNIRGKKFGYLTALYPTGEKRSRSIIGRCKCDCGNFIETTIHHLQQGDTKSCGCKQIEHITNLGHSLKKDLTGQKFGKLLVLEEEKERAQDKNIVGKCRCDCGNVCSVKGIYLTTGSVKSCGCLISKGEGKIQKLLQQLKINFKSQYTFKGCISQRQIPLKFDFYLPDYNCCIEYDGEGHYKQIGNGDFEKGQLHDKIKNQYCLDNNINLIRIPYFDYDKIDSLYLQEKLSEIV